PNCVSELQLFSNNLVPYNLNIYVIGHPLTFFHHTQLYIDVCDNIVQLKHYFFVVFYLSGHNILCLCPLKALVQSILTLILMLPQYHRYTIFVYDTISTLIIHYLSITST
ncbi:hypothetical protein ACJX0J_026892, partial [Zea mays]